MHMPVQKRDGHTRAEAPVVEVENNRQLRRAHVVQPQQITHAVHAGPVVVLDCQTRLFSVQSMSEGGACLGMTDMS
jgi:hypothetical protein